MFSVRQKREIADAVQKILSATNHPELPVDEIEFMLQVKGNEPWSFATICNNGSIKNPDINMHNELCDPQSSIQS
jgi:hypothetical protein